MAIDWIKVRSGLRRHPKVVRILSALKSDRLRVVGGLVAVWSVFDEHSVDGVLPGYSFEMMDEEIGWPGFSQAMHGVGWLERDGDCGLVMPDFLEHNGESAKRRAEDSARKRRVRSSSAEDADTRPKSVRKNTDKSRTRKEKKRNTSPSLRSGDDARAGSSDRGAPIPDGFAISEKVRKWAAKNGYAAYVDAHLQWFVDYARGGDRETGKPILSKDWDAKFRNAITSDWGGVRKNLQREQFKPGAKPPNGAVRPGEPWYITWTGIKNEALRRGIDQIRDESDAAFTDRVFAAAGVTREQAAKDRNEWRGA